MEDYKQQTQKPSQIATVILHLGQHLLEVPLLLLQLLLVLLDGLLQALDALLVLRVQVFHFLEDPLVDLLQVLQRPLHVCHCDSWEVCGVEHEIRSADESRFRDPFEQMRLQVFIVLHVLHPLLKFQVDFLELPFLGLTSNHVLPGRNSLPLDLLHLHLLNLQGPMRLNEGKDIPLDSLLSLHLHQYQIIVTINPIILMNPDYYSDIKLAQRFIFQSSIYLLNMFDKKIDSFIANKTKQARERDRLELCHPQHIIDPDRKIEDPVKSLSKDLTKPVWNCITKMEVAALCVKNFKKDPPKVMAMNDKFTRFMERYKHEHQDQSSFRVHLNLVEKSQIIEAFKEEMQNDTYDKYWSILQDLIVSVNKVLAKYEETIRVGKEKNQSNDFLETYVNFCHDVFDPLMNRREKNSVDIELCAELYCFLTVVNDQIKSVIESSQGSTVINYWPNIGLLPQAIHPLLLTVYITIKEQYFEKEERDRNLANTNQSIEEESQTIFDELQQRNCSKITFLNLDGYETPLNLQVAKYLSRYLQYISFPFQEGQALKSEQYFQYYQNHSDLLIKQYVHSELTEQQKQLQYKLFKTKQRSQKQLMQYYKKLFIFPIHSISLSSKYQLKNIEFYQSKFIKFIMKELIYIQIKEFNPSVIILSTSNKLHIQPQFYEELIKELTIIGNMKLILYNNLTKAYIYDHQPNNLAFMRHYNHKYERKVALANQNQINFSIFDKTSVFLKIASGTFTLDRTFQEDNATEKYDIFRIQKYGGNLIKILGKSHPVLERYRNRCNEYLRLERMLSNIYQSQRANEEKFYKCVPIYNQQLLQYTEKLILEVINQQQFSQDSFMKHVSREYFQREWKDFILRYKLSIQRERQDQDYKYITKFKRAKVQEDQPAHQFIALEFQIQQNGVSHLVNLSKHSQVCIQTKQEGKDAVVYLFNHLMHHRESILRNYYGVVDEKIQTMYEAKVKLQEFQFHDHNGQPFKLKPYEHFTRFNHFQNNQHILLFWPVLYDQAEALMCQFTHTTYSPRITNLIFLAAKSEPGKVIQILPSNADYQSIIPRSGCTCLQVPDTDCIYVFGGFYNNTENYLNFQVDITLIKLSQPLIVENAPKKIHFDYEPNNPNISDLPYRITRLSQDFVRPRMEYEIFEFDKNEDIDKWRVCLLGGVGERFMRPYSMIGYMAHELVFKRNGELTEIKRMRLNNVVPVNLKKAVKTRSPMEFPTINGAQNRQIYTKKMTLPANSLVYSWFCNRYSRQQQKMSYKKQIQLGIIAEARQDKLDNTIMVRQNNSNMTAKVVIRHYSSLKEVQNQIAIIYQYSVGSLEQNHSIIYSIELELSDQVYVEFVNLESKFVPLVGANIVAMDVYGLEIYAVIRHKQYTNNKYVLVYADLTASIQTLIDDTVRKIQLRQIYRFDDCISHHTIKALPEKKIVIIHAFPFYRDSNYQEFLLKRTAKGPCIREKIYNDYHSYNINNFIDKSIYRNTPISFFYTTKHTVISWTFKSNCRSRGQEEYFFLIEELNCKEETKRWKLKSQKMINFQKMFITNEESQQFITTIIDIKVTSQKKYEIYIMEKDIIYVGNFDVHLSESNNVVTFRQYDKSLNQYLSLKFRHKFNVQYLQKLTKYDSKYEDNQQEFNANNPTKQDSTCKDNHQKMQLQ